MITMIYEMLKEKKDNAWYVWLFNLVWKRRIGQYNPKMWWGKKAPADISSMPAWEGDEEGGKKGKKLTILTPNKLLSRLSVLLVQIIARNNRRILNNEIIEILYLLNHHNKITKPRSLQQFNQETITMGV